MKIGKLKYLNKQLLIVTIVFAIIGAFLILDASSISSVLRYGNDSPYYFFKSQLLYIAIGSFIGLIVLCMPTKTYGFWGSLLSFGGLVILLLTFIYNKSFNSSAISEVTITIGTKTFQPAELLKVFIIMYMGAYYEKYINKENKKDWKVIIPFILGGLACTIILLGGDLGTCALMGTLFSIIFISLPIKTKTYKYLKIAVCVCLIFALSFLKFGYLIIPEEKLKEDNRLSRLIYTNPCDRYEDETGYQACNGYIAIDNGGLFGVGIGKSVQKYLYLPESHTDFIFPIVIEEFGSIVGIIIILGYMYLIYIILKIGTNSYRLQNSIICYGIATYITLHIFVNLCGVLGLIPLTGVPLPFLSYGGSFCIVLLASLAMVQRINVENEIHKHKKPTK